MNQIMHTPATASIEAVTASKREINETNESDSEIDEFLMGPSAGIVFGRERSGLTNEEVALADSTICIPSYDNYPVLNLAQAVNIIGYEMFKRQKELTEDVKQGGTLSLRTTDRLANRGELDMFLKRLENNLDSRGYQSVSKNNNRESDKDNSDRLNQGDESKESTLEKRSSCKNCRE
jgi:tRNA C32,U32 (ribose-2'-O)-methylase TrmJ